MKLQLHHVNPEELQALLLPFLGCSCPAPSSCAPGAALLHDLCDTAVSPCEHRAGGHALTHGRTAKEDVSTEKHRLSVVCDLVHSSIPN